MVKGSSPIRQLIRRLVTDPGVRCCPDKELLGRFLDQRDEAAFETLVRRHGPLVLVQQRSNWCCAAADAVSPLADILTAQFPAASAQRLHESPRPACMASIGLGQFGRKIRLSKLCQLLRLRNNPEGFYRNFCFVA